MNHSQLSSLKLVKICWLPVLPPWLDWESHSQGRQRSICCICYEGGPWRCPPRCRTSPPPPRPPWTCTPSSPGASWGCPRGRARRHEGSRRARLAQSGWEQPIGRRSWTPGEKTNQLWLSLGFWPLLQHRPSEIYERSFPAWNLMNDTSMHDTKLLDAFLSGIRLDALPGQQEKWRHWVWTIFHTR